MAQPAAILSIVITANAAQAQTALAKTQGQLTATTKTAAGTTAAMQKLRTAAKYAGVALAVGVAYGAKKSVEAASDLEESINKANVTFDASGKKVQKWSKTTAEAMGIARAESLDAAASIGAMLKPQGIATQQASRMSRSMVQLAADMASFNNQDPSDMLERIRSGLSGEMEPLRRFGVVLSEARVQQYAWAQGIAKSGQDLDDQQKIMARYGLILQDTNEQQGDFKRTSDSLANTQRRLQAQVTNLGAKLGTALLPVVTDIANEFSDWLTILNDPKLTDSEKFDKLTDRFGELFNKAVTIAAEAAPKVAGAFVEGFIKAPILGQLLWEGGLFRKMGGAAAMTDLGTKSGKIFGRAFAYGAVALFGVELLTWLMRHREDIIAAAQNKTTYQNFLMDEEGFTAKKALNIAKITERNPGISLPDAEKILADQKKFQHDFTRINQRGSDDRQAITEKGLADIERAFGNNRDKINNTTKGQTRDVVRNTNNMVNASSEGLKRLGDNTNKALKAYGAKPLQYSIDLNKSSSGGAFHGFRRGGPINTGASSGDSVPAMLERGEYVLNRNAVGAIGKRSLDAINFGAAKRFAAGGSVLEALGPYSIPPISYDANHAGGNSHVHVGMSTSAAVVALGRKLQSMGFMVSEHPAFGGVDPVHTTNSLHYSGQAIDINSAANETRAEVASIARLLGGGGFGGAVVQKLKKLILSGPDGPLKDMGQGALNKAYAAANAFIAKSRPASDVGNVGYSSGGKGGVVAQMGKILLGSGFDRFSAAGIIGNAYRESLWNPASVGSGGGGLFGFTTPPVSLANLQSFAASQGKPWTDVGLQMQFMLAHGGMGMRSPLNALSSTAATTALFMNEWERPAAATAALDIRQAAAQRSLGMFQKGGLVPSLDRGGRVTSAGIAQVHPGDVHMGKSSPNINVYVDPVSLDVRVETIVEGMAPEIAEFTARQLGRGQGRSRQLSRG